MMWPRFGRRGSSGAAASAIGPARPYPESWLFILIVTAIVLTGAQGAVLFIDSAKRDVGPYSYVWVFAQLEVEAKTYAMALLSAAPDPANPKVQADLRSSFDIYFGRTQTVVALAEKVFSKPEKLILARKLQAQVLETADLLDGTPNLTPRDVAWLMAEIRSTLPLTRKIANAALADSITFAENDRMSRQKILTNLLGLMALVISLMIGSAGQAMRVSRAITRQAGETGQVAARLRRTINASLDAVVIVAADNTIAEHNAALRSFVTADPDVVITGRHILDFIAPVDRDGVARLMAELTACAPATATDLGKTQRIHATLLDASGTLRPVELSCAAERSLTGQPTIIMFLRCRLRELAAADVLRAARDQARLDVKAKERFLSVLSHEMRTPLQGVMASLDLIRIDDLSYSEQGFLTTAIACSRSALVQVDDVLALTRNGYLGDPEEFFLPAALIDEVVTEINPLAHERGNKIYVWIVGDAVGLPILSRRRSLKLALRNLIANAVKYTDDGRIEVILHMTQRASGTVAVEISVIDNGIGISQPDQSRIFEEFTMVSDSGPDGGSGFGLGLAITKSSVERLNGRVDLESELGQGSRFRVSFTATAAPPMAMQSIDPAPIPALPATPADPLRVMIVDDNPVNRALLAEMVRRLGHDPDMAPDGRTAVDLAAANDYDLILMDLGMPGLDGFETSRRIRIGPRNAATRILALTARDLKEVEDRIRQSGIDGAIQKPIDLRQLGDLLRNAKVDAGSTEPGPWPEVPVLDGARDVLGLMGQPMMERLLDGMFADSHAACAALSARNPATRPPACEPPAADLAPADLTAADLAPADLLTQKAHRAGGSAAVLGAARLARAWTEVERASRAADADQLCVLEPQIAVVLAQAAAAYRALGLATGTALSDPDSADSTAPPQARLRKSA